MFRLATQAGCRAPDVYTVRTDAGPLSDASRAGCGPCTTACVTCSAVPGGVTAAVAKSSDVTDDNLLSAEMMPSGTSAGRLGYPLAVGRADQLSYVHAANL